MSPALALLASLTLMASPGRARAPASPAARLSFAQTQFNRGEFQAALETLQSLDDDTQDDALLAQSKLLQGQCRAARRDFAEAEKAFAEALKHNPESSLDPARVDPTLVRMLEGLRARMKGELRIETNRPARVYIDGQPMGTSPVQTELSIGRHVLEARAPEGGDSARAETVVGVGKSSSVKLMLATVALAEPAAVVPASERAGTAPAWKPTADVRIGIDPFQYSEGVYIEVGGGAELRFLRLLLDARVFPMFGLTPRAALSAPLSEKVAVYVSFELPLLFDTSIEFGLGGAGGADYFINPWLSFFGEVGGRHYFSGPDYFDADRLTVQTGARLRLP